MQQRDAAAVQQVKTFRPADNSPFDQHLTHDSLLCWEQLYHYHTPMSSATNTHSPHKCCTFLLTLFKYAAYYFNRTTEEAITLRCSYRFIGYLLLAFGGGILLSTFLPTVVVVCLEAVVIIAVGLVCSRRWIQSNEDICFPCAKILKTDITVIQKKQSSMMK